MGQVSSDEGATILGDARLAGLDTLDTAIAYGNAEDQLGRAGVGEWRVVTKLPGIPAECTDVEGWVFESVRRSIGRLNVGKLYGLLLHHPRQLLSDDGDALYDAMRRIRSEGLVQRIGVSIYAPDELDVLTPRFAFDLVQAPFNVLDRRLVSSGWLRRLKEAGVEVHTRSAFLQGLLLMSAADRPKKFTRWQSLWSRWDAWLAEQRTTPLEACLAFVLGTKDIDRMIVGVDSRAQLKEILSSVDAHVAKVPDTIASDDQQLINPGLWNTL